MKKSIVKILKFGLCFIMLVIYAEAKEIIKTTKEITIDKTPKRELLIKKPENKIDEIKNKIKTLYIKLKNIGNSNNIFKVFPIIISVLAFLISGLTFYFNFVLKGKIELKIADKGKIFTHSNNINIVGIHIPINIINNRQRATVLEKCFLEIKNKDDKESYILKWDKFTKIIDNEWEFNEVALPIQVKGNSSIEKIVSFIWNDEKKKENINLKGGETEFNIYYSYNGKIKKINSIVNIDMHIITDMKIKGMNKEIFFDNKLYCDKINSKNIYEKISEM